MSDIQRLATQLMALDDRIVGCMKCGLCQAVCPMFGASMYEADVARGKLALIDNLAHRVIEDPEAVAEKLGRCLLCGSCQANCPSGVSIMDIFLEAREIVHAYIGLHPIKKLIFRTLLPKPGLFNFAMRLSAPCQGLLFRQTGTAQDTSKAPWLDALLGPRHIRKLAPRPLNATVGAIDTPAGKSGLKVAFFPGCLGDKMYTSMSEACIKVLRHHGVGIYMPANIACCGMPAVASGDIEGMLRMMQVNMDILAGGQFDYIVTPCASCTATIKELWPHYAHRLHSASQRQAEELGKKAIDINGFLIDILKATPLSTPVFTKTKVTYHDSCHLRNSLKGSAKARDVLALNPQYELVEMAEADRCCGCGGSFNLLHYDWSRKIGQRKRDNTVTTGAAMVATGCPACMMQLEDMLSQNGDAMTVKHTVELYAQALP